MNCSNRYEVESMAKYRQAAIEDALRDAAVVHQGTGVQAHQPAVPGVRRIWAWLGGSALFVMGVISGIMLAPILR